MSEPFLPPLRDVIEEFGLGARKALGQHFLLDLNVTRKIARLGEFDTNALVIEVGPGPGGLTRALLETGAHVLAIEKDTRCIQALSSLEEAYPGKFTIFEADALEVDEKDQLDKYSLSRPVWIASNLPYNISTELLIKWLKAKPLWWQGMVLMFQKEVADRILANPGTKAYGRLSIISQIFSSVQKGFFLPARAFTPPPKVDSCILVFRQKPHPGCEIDALERVTAAAFSQRRKMLRTSLKSVFAERTEIVLENCALKPTLRAEQVCIKGYTDLANQLSISREQ